MKKILLYNIKLFVLLLLSLNTVCDFEIIDHKNLEELRIMIKKEELEYNRLLESKTKTDNFLKSENTTKKIEVEDELNKQIPAIKKLLGIESTSTTLAEIRSDILAIESLSKRITKDSHMTAKELFDKIFDFSTNLPIYITQIANINLANIKNQEQIIEKNLNILQKYLELFFRYKDKTN